VGIEHMPELAKDSISNLKKSYSQALKKNKIIVKCGDGREGCIEHAPYNAIHVGAGKI
jgi:protein-L-isoaspartate(D-aspartate) O-methyltransferase